MKQLIIDKNSPNGRFVEVEKNTNSSEYKKRRIYELKQKLFDTDYNILKIVEGCLTLTDCVDIIKQRQSWRKEINELEKELAENETTENTESDN